MGSSGIIALTQRSIRSLSLTSDIFCDECGVEDCEVDLAPFNQLQSLGWRGLNAEQLGILSVAIQNNAANLKELELDFVNWPGLWELLGYYSDDEDESDTTPRNYFARKILGLNRDPVYPILPVIRVLSLSQVPLGPNMARCVNFDTLESLTLRLCPGWDEFIRQVAELKIPIKLKRLEILESGEVSTGDGDHALKVIIGAFYGLRELFISQCGPILPLDSSSLIVRHHAALQRFVYHQRTIDIDDESPTFEEEFDTSDLTIPEPYFGQMANEKDLNPLWYLNHLEGIALSCTVHPVVSIAPSCVGSLN